MALYDDKETYGANVEELDKLLREKRKFEKDPVPGMFRVYVTAPQNLIGSLRNAGRNEFADALETKKRLLIGDFSQAELKIPGIEISGNDAVIPWMSFIGAGIDRLHFDFYSPDAELLAATLNAQNQSSFSAEKSRKTERAAVKRLSGKPELPHDPDSLIKACLSLLDRIEIGNSQEALVPSLESLKAYINELNRLSMPPQLSPDQQRKFSDILGRYKALRKT